MTDESTDPSPTATLVKELVEDRATRLREAARKCQHCDAEYSLIVEGFGETRRTRCDICGDVRPDVLPITNAETFNAGPDNPGMIAAACGINPEILLGNKPLGEPSLMEIAGDHITKLGNKPNGTFTPTWTNFSAGCGPNPAKDAVETNAAEAAATLELHAAKIDKAGIGGIAYDLRVAAYVIRQLDPDRQPIDGLDWSVDLAEDGGYTYRCPECESPFIEADAVSINRWDHHCLSCGLRGAARS